MILKRPFDALRHGQPNWKYGLRHAQSSRIILPPDGGPFQWVVPPIPSLYWHWLNAWSARELFQTNSMVTSMALRVVPELIIFDCDGVVADSETLANQLLAESISRIGRPTTMEDSIRLFMGKRWEDCKRAIIDWTGEPLPPNFEADHRALSRDRMRTEVCSVPGLETFLAAHRSYRKCVASSSEHAWLNHCVDKFGLRPHFGRNLFSAAEVANGKPAPDIFLFAARQMGVSPETCLVLEDSPTGITGALAAGMTTVGFLGASHVLDGHAERLCLAGAHHLAKNFTEVAHLLASQSSQ